MISASYRVLTAEPMVSYEVRKQVYKATFAEADKHTSEQLVKFVQDQYPEDVHRGCAAANLAPKFLNNQKLPGGFWQVLSSAYFCSNVHVCLRGIASFTHMLW